MYSIRFDRGLCLDGVGTDMYGVKDNAAGRAYYNSLVQLHTEWGIDFIKMDCAYNPRTVNELEMVSEAVKSI